MSLILINLFLILISIVQIRLIFHLHEVYLVCRGIQLTLSQSDNFSIPEFMIRKETK